MDMIRGAIRYRGYHEYGNNVRYQMKLKVPRMILDYLVYLVEDSPSSLQKLFARNFIRVGSNTDANNDYDR